MTPTPRSSSRLKRGVGWLTAVAIAALVGSSGQPAARAAGTHRAAVVVDLGDGRVKTGCVSFSGDHISGLDALQQTSMSPVAQTFGGQGSAVCAICGKGCAAGSSCLTCAAPKYWAYFRNGRYSAVGAAQTQVHDGDVEGWKWGTGEAPAVVSFDKACPAVVRPPPPPPSTPATTSPSPTTARPTGSTPKPTPVPGSGPAASPALGTMPKAGGPIPFGFVPPTPGSAGPASSSPDAGSAARPVPGSPSPSSSQPSAPLTTAGPAGRSATGAPGPGGSSTSREDAGVKRGQRLAAEGARTTGRDRGSGGSSDGDDRTASVIGFAAALSVVAAAILLVRRRRMAGGG